MKAQGMKDAEKKQMNVTLTGKERIMDDGDILVSMTDLKSRVVYANKAFLKIAGYTQEELVGKPHNVVRHPLMPRSAFKDFWQTRIIRGNTNTTLRHRL